MKNPKSLGTTALEVVEGMQFDRGYLSAYMVSDTEKMEANHGKSADPDHGQEDQQHPGSGSAARSR